MVGIWRGSECKKCQRRKFFQILSHDIFNIIFKTYVFYLHILHVALQ